MNLTVLIVLLAGLVLSAMVCILFKDILKAAIAMAVTSAILAFIMYMLKAPLAAVFELSVCAGLITVIFISAISMTKLQTKAEVAQIKKERRRRYVYLPVLLIVLTAAALFIIWPHLNALIPYKEVHGEPVANLQILWDKRLVDLLGQIVIVIAGVFGVLIFFKEREEK